MYDSGGVPNYSSWSPVNEEVLIKLIVSKIIFQTIVNEIQIHILC